MTNSFVDTASAVREGEQLDIANLEAFLVRHVPGMKGPIAVEQFPGGHSNLTYLVKSGRQELVLRRPPYGSKVKSAHDMGREFRVLSKLHSFFGPAPEPVAFCDDVGVLGAPFYLMERIRGVVYRAHLPEGMDLPPHRVRDACYSFIETLADLHNLDYDRVGLEGLYKGPGYLERQLSGWERRWEGSKTDDIPEMDVVLRWLKAELPSDSGAVIIHNDFKFDNLIFSAEDMTTVAGVLDWEMSTVGDPLSDLGVTLSYWWQASDGPSTSVSACFLCRDTGALTREELIRTYSRRTGRDTSNLLFHYVLALYKGAVIGQQIYYRYKMGLTQDARFAAFLDSARAQAGRALRAIESGTI